MKHQWRKDSINFPAGSKQGVPSQYIMQVIKHMVNGSACVIKLRMHLRGMLNLPELQVQFVEVGVHRCSGNIKYARTIEFDQENILPVITLLFPLLEQPAVHFLYLINVPTACRKPSGSGDKKCLYLRYNPVTAHATISDFLSPRYQSNQKICLHCLR